MSKVKAREVLSVRRCGPDYTWFNLTVEGMANLRPGDEKVTWLINNNTDKTVAYVQREYYQIKDEPKRRLQVKKVKIVGPRDQIMNLLYNLGEGTPENKVGPRWEKEEEDF